MPDARPTEADLLLASVLDALRRSLMTRDTEVAVTGEGWQVYARGTTTKVVAIRIVV